MADAMKLVPVAELKKIAQALDDHCGQKTDDLADRIRALAASPPAREEAPAEGAGDDWGRYARVICESEGKQWTGLDNSREDCERWFAAGRAVAAALRNRMSEPEAGAVGQVNALYASGFGRMRCVEWTAGDMPEVGTKLYTHPAPATADKLRTAVEALEAARGHTQLTHVYAGIEQALAALNEGGKG